MSTRDSVCGRPTNQGTPCTKGRLHWWVGLFAVEYADGCKWHVSQRSREAYEAGKQAFEARRLAALYADPICWAWSVPQDMDNWTPRLDGYIDSQTTDETLQYLMSDRAPREYMLLDEWQDGRCAICGDRERLVEDHDHATGLTRGYLCHGCNTREGNDHGSATLFGKYRELHPTRMLGLNIRYWDPITKDFAQPAAVRPVGDPWKETPLALGLLD